jgi:hypothetical protein
MAVNVQKERGSAVETGGASPGTEDGEDARHQDNPGEGEDARESQERIAFEKNGGKVQRRTESGVDRCAFEPAARETSGR